MEKSEKRVRASRVVVSRFSLLSTHSCHSARHDSIDIELRQATIQTRVNRSTHRTYRTSARIAEWRFSRNRLGARFRANGRQQRIDAERFYEELTSCGSSGEFFLAGIGGEDNADGWVLLNRMPAKIRAGSTSCDMHIGDQHIDHAEEIKGRLRDGEFMRDAYLVSAIQLQHLTGHIECNHVTIDNDRYFDF